MSANAYMPNLDTGRWWAFLAVFIFHFPLNVTGHLLAIKNSLYMGVDFFFILSAFLLTHLAYAEIRSRQQFNASCFMQRRICRIWPLYFLIVSSAFIIAAIAKHAGIHVTKPPIIYYLTFTGNFYTQPHIFMLMFLWSIAIEEQYYVLLAVYFKSKLFALPIVVAVLFIGYIFYINLCSTQHIYTQTLQYLPNIAAGMCLAYLMHIKPQWFYRLASLRLWPLMLLPLLLYINSLQASVLQILTLKLLSVMVFSTSVIYLAVSKKQTNTLGMYWGKRSYGLYMWHGLTLTIYVFTTKNTLLNIATQYLALLGCLATTHGLAYLSYRYYEMPFLRLKKHIIA